MKRRSRLLTVLAFAAGLVLLACGAFGGLPALAATQSADDSGGASGMDAGGGAPASGDSARGSARAAAAGTTHEFSDDDGTKYTVTSPDTIKAGEKVTLSGTGWKTKDKKSGAAVALKLDGGASLRTFDLTLNGQTYRPKEKDSGGPGDLTRPSLWAVTQADANGDWTMTFDQPTASNNREKEAWKAGETHQFNLLSGQIKTGDVQRSPILDTAVVDPASTTISCEASEVAVSHYANGQTAQACIRRAVSTGAGSEIHVRGAGWTTADKARGARVELSLNSRVGRTDGTDFQFVHTGASGDEILTDGAGKQSDTIWFTADAADDGTFDATMKVPTEANLPPKLRGNSQAKLQAGSKLTVTLRSGARSGDTKHSATSKPLTVDGKDYAGDVSANSKRCVTSMVSPTAQVEAVGRVKKGESGSVFRYGQQIHVTGKGWCNNPKDPDSGGAVIGVKLDGNKSAPYSRHKADYVKVSATQTLTLSSLWAVIEVNSADGSFDATFALPKKGSTGKGTTEPAFDPGIHSLRLLSGSMKKNAKQGINVDTNAFCVESCIPALAPDLIEPGEDLKKGNALGFRSFYQNGALSVFTRQLKKGDWFFISLYADSGNVQYPHGTRKWLRWTGPEGAIRDIAYAQSLLPTGTFYVVMQDQEDRVRGWTRVKNPSAQAAKTITREQVRQVVRSRTTTVRGTNTNTVTTVNNETVINNGGTAAAAPAAPAAVSQPRPKGEAKAPIGSTDELTEQNTGGVTGSISGNIVTLQVGKAVKPGDWTTPFVYPGASSLGWLQVDSAGQIQVDVSNLPDGDYQLVLADRNGKLAGWAQLPLKRDAGTTGADISEYLGDGYRPAGIDPNSVLLIIAGAILVIGSGTAAAVFALRNRKRKAL
ncbi:hypothetical protein BRM1_06445 [Brevibacterium sp. BRM-1]|uniref:hypothetical protein n=1 Tax=Brevibacterium sp. BRM-1 TaxID=2999062 RepID=UPI0022821F82|nr:hypothetical protein [Brevibacterium sp. BRM-1]WAL41473.1 hypothetical protein BRM1_06445 [Brevibacterium sp. BRM-1]